MKIGMINGSPKSGESNSGIILDILYKLIKEKHEVKIYNYNTDHFTAETYRGITSNEVIILAFPLYGDSVPSHTLRLLVELENTIKREKANILTMYSIVNNGFYEGRQNHVVFEMIKHWCERSGVQFGGGIGQGSGELLGVMKNIPVNKIVFYKLYRSLKLLAKKIESKEPFGEQFLKPCFPRFLYMMSGKMYFKFRA
jgi:multimeric flavodoxin WrbA